jgi:hopene-associated glycosyltransferase HpnB
MAVAAGAALLLWGYLVLAHGHFWLIRPRLPRAERAADLPPATVVVPARDEAAMLPRTLPSLMAQRYPGALDVVVVDDGSADDTARIAHACGARLVRAGPPPAGWAGKVWALRTGVAAAGDSTYLLFTDADIAHPADSLARLVVLAESDGRDCVSLMARLRCRSWAERLLVPAFVYFFAQLYPFRRVGSRRWPTAAAAGGCLLVRRSTLERAGGIDAVRGAVIDDVAIARALKQAGGRLWLGFTDEVHSLRAYPRLANVWQMVTRTAWVQLRRSYSLLLATVAGLALAYLVPVVALAVGPRWVGGSAYALMMGSYLPILRLYRRSPLWAPLLPLVAMLYCAMTVHSAFGGQAAWKGRRPTT